MKVDQLDKYSLLKHLETLLPNTPDDERNRVFLQLMREVEGCEETTIFSLQDRASIRLEGICRDVREGELSPLDLRRKDANSDSWFAGKPLTRTEMLRATAAAALDFHFPIDIHDERVFVDLTSLSRDGFRFGIIERSWFSDFKRLHGQLYLR